MSLQYVPETESESENEMEIPMQVTKDRHRATGKWLHGNTIMHYIR